MGALRAGKDAGHSFRKRPIEQQRFDTLFVVGETRIERLSQNRYHIHSADPNIHPHSEHAIQTDDAVLSTADLVRTICADTE